LGVPTTDLQSDEESVSEKLPLIVNFYGGVRRFNSSVAEHSKFVWTVRGSGNAENGRVY
jgi:hypothetical protein